METEVCSIAPSDWQVFSVGEVCKRVTSGGTPSRARPDYYLNGTWPWVKTQELQDTWINQAEEHITDEAVANSSAKVLPANTVLLAMYGATVGQLGILRSPMACNQACCAMIVDPEKADFRYLYYHLRHSRAQLKSLATGAAQQNLSGVLIKSLRYPFAPLAEQKAIAAVLGALDDKIELNRRMNATLEATARALFQSWFVDFDPVRAKLDGSQPAGLDPATAALFPAAFQDSSIGTVPHGWIIKALGEVADLNWGDTNTTKASYISRGFTAYSASGADGYLPTFDFDRTGVVVSAIGANAGVTWLAHGKWSCIKNTLRFWATDAEVSTEFLYFATFGRERWPQRGSAQPFISQGDARAMKVLIPNAQLAVVFGNIVHPWLVQIEANDHQSRTLANLRDTLLPKLLSGELALR